MTKKEYKARNGSRFKKKEAQRIGEELENIKSKAGHITSENVVNSAKKKTSPIHNDFEWDDSKAAQEHRLQQAREMISNVVEVVVIMGEKVDQRSFHSVTANIQGEPKKVYVTLKEAVETPNYRKQLLNKAITTLENLTVTMKMFREHDTH